MFRNLGPMELGIILLIVIMIFGVGKLPQVGSAIGKSIRAFKQSQADDDEEEEPKPKKRRVVRKKATAAKTAEAAEEKTQSA